MFSQVSNKVIKTFKQRLLFQTFSFCVVKTLKKYLKFVFFLELYCDFREKSQNFVCVLKKNFNGFFNIVIQYIVNNIKNKIKNTSN